VHSGENIFSFQIKIANTAILQGFCSLKAGYF